MLVRLTVNISQLLNSKRIELGSRTLGVAAREPPLVARDFPSPVKLCNYHVLVICARMIFHWLGKINLA